MWSKIGSVHISLICQTLHTIYSILITWRSQPVFMHLLLPYFPESSTDIGQHSQFVLQIHETNISKYDMQEENLE